jgi:hypothetical protein
MNTDGEQLNILEKTMKIIEEYGIWKTIRGLLVVAVFLFIVSSAPSFFDRVIADAIEKQSVEQAEEHNAALEIRQQAKPAIDGILNDALLYLNADRVFIIEMHNGTNNTAGLPFLYGEMTYENAAEGILHVDDDYSRINLSRFNFCFYLQKERIWVGSIDELAKLDEKLAKRVSSNDVTYLAVTQIVGANSELGYFGVSYCNNNEHKSAKEIKQYIYTASQKLASLLDMSNIN